MLNVKDGEGDLDTTVISDWLAECDHLDGQLASAATDVKLTYTSSSGIGGTILKDDPLSIGSNSRRVLSPDWNRLELLPDQLL